MGRGWDSGFAKPMQKSVISSAIVLWLCLHNAYCFYLPGVALKISTLYKFVNFFYLHLQDLEPFCYIIVLHCIYFCRDLCYIRFWGCRNLFSFLGFHNILFSFLVLVIFLWHCWIWDWRLSLKRDLSLWLAKDC